MLGLAAVLSAACGDDPAQPETTIRYPGSAASLQAAIDLASVGETVLVGPGTHTIDAPVVVGAAHANITLLGDTSHGSRPILQFALTANQDAIYVSATNFHIAQLEIAGTYRDGVTFNASGCVLSDCIVRDAGRDAAVYKGPAGDGRIEHSFLLDAARFGIEALAGADPAVDRNTIAAAGDCGVYTESSAPTLTRNIIVRSANIGVACFLIPAPSLSCNALFQNTTDDYLGCTGPTDIHADPKFCSDTAYTLMADSPCAQANAGSCGQMGAGNVCGGP